MKAWPGQAWQVLLGVERAGMARAGVAKMIAWWQVLLLLLLLLQSQEMN